MALRLEDITIHQTSPDHHTWLKIILDKLECHSFTSAEVSIAHNWLSSRHL